jgi:hypothetical protein
LEAQKTHAGVRTPADQIFSEPPPVFKKAGQKIWEWCQIEFSIAGLCVSFLVFIAAAALFLKSGLFVAGVMLDDTLLYTESGYRVASGQLPGIHFTSAHGVLWYLPLAMAFRLTGDLVRSVPISFVVFAGIIFVLAVYLAWTRLSLIVGTLVVLFCSIFVMAPWAVGFKISPQGSTHTTAAMGYNRLGFAVILLTSLLILPPNSACRNSVRRWDTVFALASFGIAFYTKMPFGLGVAGLVCLRSFLADEKWQTVNFIVGVAILMSVVEVMAPGLHVGYAQEMMMHAQINQALKVRAIARAIYETAPEMIVVAGLPILAMATQCRCNWRCLLFFAGLLAGSIVLLTQSFQGPYLIAPLAIAVIAITILTDRREKAPQRVAVWAAAGAFAFGFWTYFFPAANAIIRHAWYASRSLPIPNMPQSYASLRVPSDIDLRGMEDAFSNKLNGEQAYAAARSTEPLSTVNALFENEYVLTLTDLPSAQLLCGRAVNRTAILDFANVSSSLLGHPPVGGYTYAHFLRGFSQSVHWPANQMFSGVDCLFDPKLPDVPSSRSGLWLVYGEIIEKSFTHVGETRFWKVLIRNDERPNARGDPS